MKKILITTDVGNEADDQFALVHALLSPSLEVKGIVPTLFNEKNSIELTYQKAVRICSLVERTDIPIARGSATLFRNSDSSLGSKMIIDEVKKLPSSEFLYIVVLGGLTDVALALKQDPAISSKIIIIWVGGGRYPKGSHEANFERDQEAANWVLQSPCKFWQIPSDAYKQMRVSTKYLNYILKRNRISKFLMNDLHQFIQKYETQKEWINPEVWVLGDESAIGVLLEEQKGNYDYGFAPFINKNGTYINKQRGHRIRIYREIDRTMILEDLIAKINLYNRN